MSKITTSSTAEYFAKNLQQVGFSSPTKAVLTTLKEAIDNALDACEEAGIAPELTVMVNKVGKGSTRTADLVEIIVEDNGPGIDPNDLSKVFGEYLASSKFGRGQCSRGQQGIGISAATTWAQLTNAAGVSVISKTNKMRKAMQVQIDVDIKGNKGLMKNKETIDWEKEHGTRVEFRIDGRVQLNGDGGLITYLDGTTLVNPHLTLHYKLMDKEWVHIDRVSDDVPRIPSATMPHPHTMKLGEFMTHAHLYGKISLERFLRKGFSRVTEGTIKDLSKNGLPKPLLGSSLTKFKEAEFKKVFQVLQATELANPSTRSVLTVGEEGLSKSIHRLGEVDFFSVVTRRPRICDFKPVVVEVAIARFLNRPSDNEDTSIQLLRFANRVPLQFDKAACAITKAVESVNWRSYGLQQSRNSLPNGPYVFAVSVTSPFIKFKNASKETIDASDELVEEIRRALMQAGQKLSRHIKREHKAADLERKLQHIEKFGPILVAGLVHITGASNKRKVAAEQGLQKLLGRDSEVAETELAEAEEKLQVLKAKQRKRLGVNEEEESGEEGAEASGGTKKTTTKKAATTKKTTTKTVAGTKKTTAKKATTKKLAGTKKTTVKKATTKKTTAKKAAARKKK
ncbi:MAG: DNA topoisomerase VI subunit B [Bdellovibrionaceae bacterium]|nr:DNA topoisomerase VI subunit B [Bdellovibrionales bacterium]MCB9084505.1 DNA topoisomerase VI subunit B [Pseudobdellovibrionaceae bacterium]